MDIETILKRCNNPCRNIDNQQGTENNKSDIGNPFHPSRHPGRLCKRHGITHKLASKQAQAYKIKRI